MLIQARMPLFCIIFCGLIAYSSAHLEECQWGPWVRGPCRGDCSSGTAIRTRTPKTIPYRGRCEGPSSDVVPCEMDCVDDVLARFCASTDRSGFFPVGVCTPFYLVCTPHQQLGLFCADSESFDTRLNECRPRTTVRNCPEYTRET